MTEFLIREFQDASVTLGKCAVPTTVREVVITKVPCPSGKLPRISKGYESIGKYQNGDSYVPWAVTSTGRVVYAQTGGHSGENKGNWSGTVSGYTLRKYNHAVSHERRRLCESELGMIALNNTALTSDAVQKVSKAMINWLKAIESRERVEQWTGLSRQQESESSERLNAARKLFGQNKPASGSQNSAPASTPSTGPRIKDVLFKEVGHYMHTYDANKKQAGMGFGRFSEKSRDAVGSDNFWVEVIEKLQTGQLGQIMALHDAIGRKVLPKFGGPQTVPYDFIGGFVRKPWFDDANRRGRINAPTKATPTTVGGTVPATQGTQVPATLQSRNRGIDMYARDEHRTRERGADAYYDDVDARHLLFGAGISGTTGTLLQAAIAFSDHLNLEEKKQYVLAIIGYLVGGGMHSYHESMAVAQKVGVPYSPGCFIPSLPQKFLHSPHFKSWHEKYYDIVELGAIHWMYNVTSLPSHMNKQLTCATCGKQQALCPCRR